MRLGGNAILLKDVHLKKAGTPISVWLVGSVISLRDVHPWKVYACALHVASRKPQSASDKPGHKVEHVTRRV